MTRYYVVPEDYLKKVINDSIMLNRMVGDPDADNYPHDIDEELSKFGVIESSDTVVDNAIITKSVHDDIFVDFVDRERSITQQASLPFNDIQQQGVIQQDVFKVKQ